MRSINSSLFELLNLLLFLEVRDTLALETLRYLLPKALDACVEQEDIIVSLLKELCSVIDARLLVKVVEHYDFTLFVLVSVKLWDELISFDAHSWKIQSLSYVIVFVVFGIA